jgi:ppGpp synthetase/RelA/SpoT-type nucleotidyltranferase
VADLYRRSYSLRRHLRSRLKEMTSLFKKPDRKNGKVDRGLSVFKLGMAHISGLRIYLKMRNNYRIETSPSPRRRASRR